MHSFLNRLLGWLLTPRPKIVCNGDLWIKGVDELKRRTLDGQRESGAFLLGRSSAKGKEILEFIFYDDIDASALDSGIVQFNGNKFPVLWEICRKRGYGVVADVHVHPAGYEQSYSDKRDPVMPRAGHFAFIIPHFCKRGVRPGEIGQYEYLGNGNWVDRSNEASNFFKLGG